MLNDNEISLGANIKIQKMVLKQMIYMAKGKDNDNTEAFLKFKEDRHKVSEEEFSQVFDSLGL